MRKLLGMMNVLIILIVVMISQICIHTETYQFECFKCVWLLNINYTSIKLLNQATEQAMGYGQPHARDQEEEIKLSLEKSCCLRDTS